jgi:hypothetical protein
VCTQHWNEFDLVSLGLVAKGLKREGLSGQDLEACVLPLHPPGKDRLMGNTLESPRYETPGGDLAWSTDLNFARPNVRVSINSSAIRRNMRFVQREDRKWTIA